VEEAIGALKVKSCILDGEITICRPDGVPRITRFADADVRLRRRRKARRAALIRHCLGELVLFHALPNRIAGAGAGPCLDLM
jgi:ATP-dependent DNA ligase